MSRDHEKDILTYEAAETVYLPVDEEEEELSGSGESRNTSPGQTGREPQRGQAGREYPANQTGREPQRGQAGSEYSAGRAEREFQAGPPARNFSERLSEKSVLRSQDAAPGRRGVLLEEEVSLGAFYVPAGIYSRGGGGQALIYDCCWRGESVPSGESGYVAKLYRPPRNNRERMMLEKTKEVNRILSGLDHPNLPRLYAEGTDDNGRYYVVVMKRYDAYSQFLELESFNGSIRLFEQRFLEEMEGLNSALMLLHERKIYHSDIKPANIMQYEDKYGREHLVLIDFGIGVRGEDTETKVGVAALGKTDFYLPPELYNVKKRKVNPYTDYYSFGMTMAEFVAGRYPMRNNMRDRVADREYAERNRNSANQFYGLLLPEELPDYLARFFEGTLYGGADIPIEELYRRRWASKEVSEWLSAVQERDYKRVHSIPTGLQIEAEEAKRKGTGVHVKYDSEEQAIVVHSTEEMAMMFLAHWEETIEKLLHVARWSRIFSKFGEDVSELMEQTRLSMRADKENRESIFDRMLMETYLPAHVKEEELRYRSLLYPTKKDFGQGLYAMLLQEKKTTEGCYRLPGKAAGERRDLFCLAMEMFACGIVEQFFKGHQGDWKLGETEIGFAKKIRESLREESKTGLVETLYRLSFRLQGEAYLYLEGMGTFYRRNGQFLKDFRQLYQKKTDDAAALLEQCFDGKDRLRMDYYVFLQEAPDVVKRPDESMRESL